LKKVDTKKELKKFKTMNKLNNYTSSDFQNFFDNDLSKTDPDLFSSIKLELERQQQHIELIASENIVSKAVLDAQGSIMTNKYAEGYPSKRYYGGCEFVDKAEDLALSRVKKLFNCKYANVQPHSGAQANGAVYLALLQPGDTILGMSLNSGGHLTHGAKVSLSGKWLKSFHYEVDKESGLIDYDLVESLAVEHNPKIIIAGGSAYSRIIDFKKFRDIADKVKAYLMVDMAHFSGLVAGNGYPNPVEFADVVTSTTHKVLRGARGGIILSNNEDIIKKVNSAVFPGYQGGPLMHVIAAKAVAFQEALQPSFKNYVKLVLSNAKVLSENLKNNGFKIFSGGTDTHLMLVDLRPFNVTGKDAEVSLCKANITCNKNGIPFDTEKMTITSGIRLGTQAATTRGFESNEFKKVGDLITKVIVGLSKNLDDNSIVENEVKKEVIELCSKYPIYNHLIKN
jgi:glycine hydroxymethyltransferase